MLIVADENIPCVGEAFGSLGRVRLLPGRSMTAESVRDAGLLLVRSVTRVDRALLEGSGVRFVGTATIGTDHVDRAFLSQAGIPFAAAPGSNANSVAEYVIAALLVAAGRRGWTLRGRSIGIIGVGNVGSRLETKARALGMRVLLNDPPLRRATGDPKYAPLDDLFQCDFLTLHVPLEKEGPDTTYHLAGEEFLSRMGADSVLLNTSRGAVADNPAILRALDGGHPSGAVLDVWEGEPVVNPDLLLRVLLATPHIAGYSLDGKVNGTEMIYRAACEHLRVQPTWTARDGLPKTDRADLTLPSAGRPQEDVIREAVVAAYSIERDDDALRQILALPLEARGPAFDRLRKEYPVRREFHNLTLGLTGAGAPDREELVAKLRALGFKVSATEG